MTENTDVQELLSSWAEHLKKCDLIFLRAPSFNRQMFYGNKNPPFKKDDMRIRTIPFPTRRPTLNEVKRVHQMLASVECYGEATDIQDFVPMSPLRHFSPETGKLEIVSEDALRRSPRKLKDKDLSTSPLASSPKHVSSSPSNKQTGKLILPDHLLVDDNLPSSSAASTASEADLVEMEEVISTLDLNPFDSTPVKKRNRKKKHKRRPSLKHQIEPDGDVYAEEKYHLRNALYTACKVGDKNSLRDLLAILNHPAASIDSPAVDSEPVMRQGEVTQEGPGSREACKDHAAPQTGVGLSGGAGNNRTTEVQGQGFLNVESSDVVTCSLSLGSDNGESQGHLITDTTDVKSRGVPQSDGELSVDTGRATPQIHVFCHEGRNTGGGRTGEGDSGHKTSSKTETVDEEKIYVENDDVTTSTRPLSQGKESDINGESIPGNQLTEKTATKPDGLPGLLSGLTSTKPNFELSPLVTLDVLNEPFGDNGTTLLHVTSKEGHNTLVRLLLKAGSDPSVKDKFGKVPFTVAEDKETRNEFRRFMGEFPDKYDYSKAQIPSALTAGMEVEKRAKEAERKKKQRKAKQERMKEKVEETAKMKAEEFEKKRFLALSDREKRALAAERRLVQQRHSTGAAPTVLSRCWQCAGDMTGKVPFEYSDFKFCSSKCLQLHRKAAKS